MSQRDRPVPRARFAAPRRLRQATPVALLALVAAPLALDRGPRAKEPVAGWRLEEARLPHAVGASVGEVTADGALVHTYLLSRPPEELLAQPYAERVYACAPGRIMVEHAAGELAPAAAEWSPGSFERHRREAASRFTSWIDVPQGAHAGAVPPDAGVRRLLDAASSGDCSARVALRGLEPATDYAVRVWVGKEGTEGVRAGPVHRFRTAPAPGDAADVGFVAGSCLDHGRLRDLREGVRPARGFRVLAALHDALQAGALEADFLVLNGDTVYLDKQAPRYRRRPAFDANAMRARYLDNALLPGTRDLLRRLPVYATKDDHDWRFNDADPVYDLGARPAASYAGITKHYRGPPDPFLGKALFEEMLPVGRGAGHRPYRRFRWGRGLEVWLLEARECRHPNALRIERYQIEGLSLPREGSPGAPGLHYPDYCGVPGPDELWGPRQTEWLLDSLRASDAAFKVVVSPTPVLGPDQRVYLERSMTPLRAKADNHVRRFRGELSRFLEALRRDRIANVVFVSGDRHFIWHSRYTGRDGRFVVHEIGNGPIADHIVPLGDVLFEDPRGRAELVAAKEAPGFVHVRVRDVARAPRLHVEWYFMEDVASRRLERWSHRLTLPSASRASKRPGEETPEGGPQSGAGAG